MADNIHHFMNIPIEGKMLRLSLKTWRGQDIADLRFFYHDENGELKATKQGVQLNADVWDTVAEYLNNYLQLRERKK